MARLIYSAITSLDGCLEHRFDPDAVRGLEASAEADLSVAGPGTPRPRLRRRLTGFGH